VDPTVGAIIAAAGAIGAPRLVTDTERAERLRVEALSALEGCDALLVPTTTAQPTIAEVAADPVGVNSRLGIYTTFCNVFDLCGVAVPAGRADGGPFGVTVLARPFADRVAVDLAARLTAGPAPAPAAFGPPAVELLVVGAHRSGQPLNHQLTERGARRVATVRTAACYQLYALETEPPKPGLVRRDAGGAAIEGELWALGTAALGAFLAELPPPMALGPVRLEDGRTVVGFGCEPAAVEGARDITAHGSWPAYLTAREIASTHA
jgi:allophanate hydrolase